MSHKKVLFNLVVITAIIAVAAAGCMLLIMNKQDPEKRSPTHLSLLVKTTRVTKKSEKMNVVGYGRARSKKELLLIAEVSGRIDFISPRLRTGKTIKKDTLLVRIDQRAYRFASDRAHALVESARTQLLSLDQEKKNDRLNLELAQKEVELGQREYERAESLLKNQSGSAKALDMAQETLLAKRTRLQVIENRLSLWPQRYAMAEASLKESQSMASDADLKLEYTEIYAPFDCRAIERQVEEDQFVAAGAALARVFDADMMEIAVDVPLRDFVWIDTASFFDNDDPTSGSATTAATASTLRRRPWAEARLEMGERVWRWRGEVVRVDGRVNQATHTVDLIAEVSPDSRIESPGAASAACDTGQAGLAQLMPGLYVEVEFEGVTVDNLVELPRGALDHLDQVRLIVDGKLVTRQTHVLRAGGGRALIDSGLEAGEEVILTPLTTPVEGMSVHSEYSPLRPIAEKEESAAPNGKRDKGSRS